LKIINGTARRPSLPKIICRLPQVRQQLYLFLAQQPHLARAKSPVSKRSYSNSLQASDFVVKGRKDTPNLTLESLRENDAYLPAIDLENRLKTSSAFGQIHTRFCLRRVVWLELPIKRNKIFLFQLEFRVSDLKSEVTVIRK
jgi:hypothetical protein